MRARAIENMTREEEGGEWKDRRDIERNTRCTEITSYRKLGIYMKVDY